MYEEFFGLTRPPFSLTLDPDLMYATAQHREALAGIFYAVATKKGLLVLTGEVGTGKTTVLRAALQKLAATYKDRLHCALIVNPHLSPDEALEFVMTEIGIPQLPSSKVQRLLRFQEFLMASKRAGKICALVVDEAHRLSPDLLEEIRLWTNFETADSKLLQVMLSGQPELADLLNRPDLRQVKQRVAVRVSLKPLAAGEVKEYIEHRWRKAGGTTPPFTDEAIETLTHLSRGFPRVLNVLCDNALLLGFASDERVIGSVHILQAATELDLTAENSLASFDDAPFGAQRSS